MPKTNWKRAALMWQGLAHVQSLAIAAVSRDPNYKCQCGTPPYTDGEMCPKCFAIYAHEEMAEMQKRWVTSGSGPGE